MILYVVRHGQTKENQYGLIKGQTECDLSEKGIEDAKELRTLVKEIGIDVVISSPLRRTVDTAKIITDGNFPINTDDRLIERNWGLCEGVSVDLVDNVKYWNFYINTNENEIERVQDLMKRVSEFIEDIKARYSDKKVLVVTHSAALRAIHYSLHPIPEDGDLSKIEIPNLRILEYEI